ncbi:FYVE, RhoGEF and PH domain-containing protein 6-like [Sphaeramia orbicularis]|uniref:FYVE, RhoGEF and PH domain-containing protein 6-like n=1 Tax=Sphaeramia orbicularis TaxID=375764 RepID=UPI00117D7354|nr:FYVE, RhoGEF and PH domain-containing protein 6-like [Sphaeramia orbicularis]
MMKSGVQKPPVAPKPKTVQPMKPGLSPATPRRNGLSLPSPGTARRTKPALAPKPCLSKCTTGVESIPLTSKSLHQTSSAETPLTVGLLNSQNGIQEENKKSNWDYIIPICLCSQENCMCLKTSADRMDLKTPLKGKTEENRKAATAIHSVVENIEEKTYQALTNICLTNHKSLQETLTLDNNFNTDKDASSPSFPAEWPDETKGAVMALSAPEQGLEEDCLGSDQLSNVPQSKAKPVPVAPRKPCPVPVPRKPRKAGLAHQEKEGEATNQDGREMIIDEVKLSSEGKSCPSSYVSVSDREDTLSHFICVKQTSAPPAPPPRKKPFLSAPEKALASSPQDVEEQDLGWDSNIYEMEISVDKEDEESGKQQERQDDQAVVYSDLTHRTSSISRPPAVTVTEEKVVVKAVPKKPERRSMAWMQRKEGSEEKEEQIFECSEKRQSEPEQDSILKERLMRELPLNPHEKTSIALLAPTKPSRSSLSKAKSFSGADIIRSEGQRRNSFRKLLDLKLTVKMLPKLIVKGTQTSNVREQSVDKGPQNNHEDFRTKRKYSCPLIGVEQNVDGDVFPPEVEQGVDYENIPLYEEIADYVNLDVGKEVTSPWALQLPDWQSSAYNDEGIYEEQEPYMPLQRNTAHQQEQYEYPRGFVHEEVVPLDGPSDDDIMDHSSDDEEEEEDSSSISSKGDIEPTEESVNEKKKTKILHIATEIMSSESVFVDVLKLLHVDFRDAVSKASRKSGKPVIENQLLNQILYYLPQLYELNKDLLKELKQRVAKWDEKPQVADIFLKKGPYLKMYSMYIREFDKNVALLEEQTKKNPAFGAVVRKFEASPCCANLALKHYLLKPVQRIPQYQLLLTDYLKNLSEDCDDYKDTQAALVIVKEVANHANDIMKQGDIFQKLIQVQCRLTGYHEIVHPGRIFLREGILKKLSRKVMQPRMFFLFNDILLYTTPVQSGQFKVNNMLSLAGMKVSKPTQEAYQNELNIESVERSFILSASSALERDDWLEAISTAITDYTKKKISFISGKTPDEVELRDATNGAPLGSKAPIWIPDPRTTMCMICTCEFSLTWRRHHCRACGKVVCQSCSSNKHCLAYLKNQLARVCDQCFIVLQQQKCEQTLPSAVSSGSKSTFAFSRKQKKIPAALKEVSASTGNSSMSGYLQRSKGNRKQGKRLWFVIKDKVLYTYAASEDVAALESQPLLGFVLKVDSSQNLQFKLYHKNTLYYIFKADDTQTAQRWIESFKEATVL